METETLIQEFPDKAARRKHILQNQLYGISPDPMCQLMSTRTVYGTINGQSNIISFGDNYLRVMQNTNKTFLYNRLKEEFSKMNFDVVIGNPPYNKGMDLDFVDLGYKVSDKYVCMITPAKWQTAEATQRVSSKSINYGQFRKLYVPHMSDIIYYAHTPEVFEIAMTEGISAFLLDKYIHATCRVTNACKIQPIFSGTVIRDIRHTESLVNVGNEIFEHLCKQSGFSHFKLSQYEGGAYIACG